MLFTDLANPTSNGVYVRLGYRRVGDSVRWRFDPQET
jgi:predicted GNAT family acetyltransferase